MKIHLSQYKLYSADELRHYLSLGLISLERASGSDLNGFCERLVENLFTLEKWEKERKKRIKKDKMKACLVIIGLSFVGLSKFLKIFWRIRE